ncbi:MAG: ADP,ATP carrier protein 1 [Chlamydiia bacterium]|nr:ADP,ATP carrier protein 1 [Chlamydiia bacterium]
MKVLRSLSSVKEKIWPIQRFELQKLLPLILMKFFISLVYAVLTCMKDTLVVTAEGSGAEIIPVLKGWFVLPVAIIATLIYSKLSNIFNRSTLFYATIGSFIGILLLYGFVLYPNANYLQPHASANALQNFLGGKAAHWVSIYRHWIHSLFFVTAELWASLVIFLLFWGLTNHITSVSEAKRTYTIFIAAGDIATFIAGPLVLYYVRKLSHMHYMFTIKQIMLWVCFFCVIIMVLHWILTKKVLTKKEFAPPPKLKKEGEKTKLSLIKGIKHVFSSKYLIYLAIMVVAYSLCINMIEVTWKAHLKILHPDPAGYQYFMSKVTSYVGLVAFITVLFFGGGIIRFFGWHFSAQLTPIIVGCTGLLFFFFVLLNQHFTLPSFFLGASPLIFLVFFGAVQNVISKVMKYSFFDPTKEIAFIPLDVESKTKGKAAIDVVGSRLGKSGSSWIQVGLIDLIGTGSILSITHVLTPIMAIACVSWIMAIRGVNKEFAKKEAEV